VGPIPQEIQINFDSSAALFTESTDHAAGRDLLRYLARADNAAKFTQAGLEQLVAQGEFALPRIPSEIIELIPQAGQREAFAV